MSNAAVLIAGAAFSLIVTSTPRAQDLPVIASLSPGGPTAASAAPGIDFLASHLIEVPDAAVDADAVRWADLGDAGTVSDTELNANRGGQAIVIGNQTLTAITSGNTLTGDYVAGSVTLADSAFSNFTGVGNIAINTGAQVSLQSGVNVIINVGQ